jgi:hypothetical protein
MKWYYDQTPETGRKAVIGPFESQQSATDTRNRCEQNLVAARATDQTAPFFTYGTPYEKDDGWNPPVCNARVVKSYEGVEREFMIYSDGTEELVPLEA